MTQPNEWTDGEYPTEAAVERVRSWPAPANGDWSPLLGFVRDIWKYADAGFWHEEPAPRGGTTYRISTGGWSGNEEIAAALRGNQMFWMMCWAESRRGGHYTFQVRPQ
jgi:hypothetical protein